MINFKRTFTKVSVAVSSPLRAAFLGVTLFLAFTAFTQTALADSVLIIDASYSTVTQNVRNRLLNYGHTVTITSDTSQVPTGTGTYQQVWDLRYSAALTSGETTNYTSFITAGGFAYFVTENPGCCMARNNSVAALVTGLGGGTTQIGPGWAANIESNVNTTYMTSGITVNYAAVAAIVNSQGIPLISDSSNVVSGMSWIGRAGAMGSGVLGTIVTVADTNWLDSTRMGSLTSTTNFDISGLSSAQQQNVQALDDIITGIVAGTVGGTISASGNGAAASNGASGGGGSNTPTTYDHTNTTENVATNTMATGTFTGNGGTLTANSAALTISNNIVLDANGMTYDANGQNSSLTGVISGSGDITFTGSGTTTLTGTNTYTGATTINSGATLVNDGSIASSSGVTNAGTFTNNGQAPGVTNSGTFTNSSTGTAASLTNSGTATNAGTITGTVTNTGTFTNSGTTGNWTNSSTLTNTGTMGNGTNTGTMTSSGTVGTVTNNTGGTFTNNGITGAVANNATFTNNANKTTGAVANTGTFTNNGTTGAITGNTGTFTNAGTTGDWVNNGTMSNSGTMGNGTNNSLFTNTGAVGTVTNTGTFANTGTLTSINNSGTFATTPVTLTTYTQSNAGATILDYGSKLTVSGSANLDGNLTMIGTAYSTLGRYTVLTGNGVTGTFSSYTGVGVLRYTGTEVQIWVMPDGSVVQARVNAWANAFNNLNSLANSSTTSALGNDCSSFGNLGACASVNYGTTKAGTGDLNTTGVTLVKSLNSNWRVGVFGQQQLKDAAVGDLTYGSKNPSVGFLVGWNQYADTLGYSVVASTVSGSGSYTIGVDKTGVDVKAHQVKLSYTKPLSMDLMLSPYVGVRRTELKVGGFTESGAEFPLTMSGFSQTTTDLLAGVSVSKKLRESLTGSISAGLVHNLQSSAGQVSVSSDMGSFSSNLSGGRYTSASLGASLNYEVVKNHRIGVNIGWQQRNLNNANINSVGLSYSLGF